MATRVPRPDSVKVGNHQYSIVWLTTDEWLQGHHPDEADGTTYSRANIIVIKLDSEAQESHYQEVVVHEVMHAVWDETMATHYHGNVDEEEREEFLVGLTSPAMLAVLKDNSHLVKYLVSDGYHRRT